MAKEKFHGDCSWQSYLDAEGNRVLSNLDARGREIPDSTPLEPPVGYREGPSLADTVHRIIRTEMSRVAEDMGMESFEEADDFDIEDDPPDPSTPYEEVFDPRQPPPPANGNGAASEAPKEPGGPSGASQATPATQSGTNVP